MAGVRKIVFSRLKNTPKSRGRPRAPPKGFRPKPIWDKPCLGVYNSTTLSRIRSVIRPNPEICCPSGKLSLKYLALGVDFDLHETPNYNLPRGHTDCSLEIEYPATSQNFLAFSEKKY